jgi:hypothetical protein
MCFHSKTNQALLISGGDVRNIFNSIRSFESETFCFAISLLTYTQFSSAGFTADLAWKRVSIDLVGDGVSGWQGGGVKP